MARKPLIDPGSILPPAAAAGDSLVDRVIQRDRTNSGRTSLAATAAAAATAAKTPPEQPEQDNITSNITAHMPANIRTQKRAQKEIREYSQEDAQAVIGASSVSGRRAEAQKRAKQLSSGTALPITLRLPDGLNDYLDEAAHEHRKQGVKKQDLVSLAVQLLVIELESGADLSALLRGDFEQKAGEGE